MVLVFLVYYKPSLTIGLYADNVLDCMLRLLKPFGLFMIEKKDCGGGCTNFASNTN